MHVHMCVHICACACGYRRLTSSVFLSGSPPVLWDKVSHWTWYSLIQPVSSRNLPVSIPWTPGLELHMHDPVHGFCKDATDPVAGLHICATSILLTEPFSEPPSSLENLISPCCRAFEICLLCLFVCCFGFFLMYLEPPCLPASSSQTSLIFHISGRFYPFLHRPNVTKPKEQSSLLWFVV